MQQGPVLGRHLKDIFSSNLCDTHARILFFTKFHSLRLSKSVQTECVSLFILNGCEEKRRHYPLPTGVSPELPTEILGRVLQENRTTSSTHADQISNMDQQILYNISGFIVANLKKKRMRMNLYLLVRELEIIIRNIPDHSHMQSL